MEGENVIEKEDTISCKTGHAVNGIVPGEQDVEYSGRVCDCGRILFYKERCTPCGQTIRYELKQKENI